MEYTKFQKTLQHLLNYDILLDTYLIITPFAVNYFLCKVILVCARDLVSHGTEDHVYLLYEASCHMQCLTVDSCDGESC